MGTVVKGVEQRRVLTFLLIIIVLAIALRAGFVSTLEEEIYWPDPTYYDTVAWRIASGEPLGNAVGRAPMQAFLMAVPYSVVGHSYQGARYFQALLGGLIPLLVFLITRRLRNAQTGLLAALLAAIYPYYIYAAGTLYATQTTTILLLAVIYLAVRARQEPGFWVFAAQGVSLGALILTRSIALALVPIAFLWNLRGRRPIISAFLVCITASAVVAPWTARNYRATGEFILVSVGGGRELIRGNNPGALASPYLWARMPEDFRDSIRGLPYAEWDRRCFDEAFAHMRETPGTTARLYGAKLLNLYRFYPNTVTDNRFTETRTKWIAILSYGPIFLLGLFGIWIERRRWRSYLPILATIGTLTLLYPVFTTCVRYRLPIDALLIVFCSVALATAAARLGGGPARFFGEGR